ncbi:MAG: hypothetical protein D3906_11690 [Candidatus Electrothrix sp. AUS1_2]|nr:hypothetical protein [Candidatus Electrothrix sp. AUS1_2]
MPNTLAHFGVQILLTKAAVPKADSKWIGLGCLLPDIPWILQRLLAGVPRIDPVDLRIYTIIQSSLFFCLLLSATIALLTRNSRKVFLILALNSLLHLLLDACQIKWANGSLFFAPFYWKLTGFAWFWPEDRLSLLLTVFGLIVFLPAAWRDRTKKTARKALVNRHAPSTPVYKHTGNKKRLALLLSAGYFLLPFCFFTGPISANNHYVATLRSAQRRGLEFRLDRRPYRGSDQTVLSYNRERFHLKGENLPVQNSILSLQGQFITDDTILVEDYHVHQGHRDSASKIGIFLLGMVWLVALREKRSKIGKTIHEQNG